MCVLTVFPSLASVQLGAAISSGGLQKGEGEVHTSLEMLGMGFLCVPAEHLFYRDGELSLAATLMLPQNHPGMCQGCVSQCAKQGLALGPGPEGRSCWGVEVLKPGCGVKL